MTEAATLEPGAEFVEATLSYTVNTGEKPVTSTAGIKEVVEDRRGERSEHLLPIRNGRPIADELSMDVQGFVFVRHDTKVKSFYDRDELKRVYYPETEQLVKDVTGATRVLVFDDTLRAKDEGTRDAQQVREPVFAVHNDYTEWSGPQRVRDLLPADEAEELLKHRMMVVQVWRPINQPVDDTPLAICDARSMAPEDWIASERRYPDRVGEIYQVSYNPEHAWYYFPQMRREEALVFKCYDSLTDGRARFTAHTGFVNPSPAPDAAPRESIEMRTLVFFEED